MMWLKEQRVKCLAGVQDHTVGRDPKRCFVRGITCVGGRWRRTWLYLPDQSESREKRKRGKEIRRNSKVGVPTYKNRDGKLLSNRELHREFRGKVEPKGLWQGWWESRWVQREPRVTACSLSESTWVVVCLVGGAGVYWGRMWWFLFMAPGGGPLPVPVQRPPMKP